MAEAVELQSLIRRDLLPHNCPTLSLEELAYVYFEDKESLELIAAELERRGIDPYA